MSEQMPKVTAAEVQRIAHLSKLALEGDELARLTEDFNQILSFVQQINEAETSQAEVFDHVLDLANVRRPDVTESSFSSEEVRKLAPAFEAGFFVVPRVIEM